MMESYERPEASATKTCGFRARGRSHHPSNRQKLNQTFITPIDREDIYSMTSALDDVLDLIEAAADRMVLYKIKSPTPRRGAEQHHLRIRARDHPGHMPASRSEQRLRPLRGDQPPGEQCRPHYARGHRPPVEGDCSPCDVIKWKEIYETLEAATDKCEDVANIIEAVVLKHS